MRINVVLHQDDKILHRAQAIAYAKLEVAVHLHIANAVYQVTITDAPLVL